MNQITSLPTGTITFLFTDIEGSTKLWETHPDAMRGAVARHDAILRQAVQDNDGYLFKTTGDGIAAAFALASDALAAALTAQQLLLAEPWSELVTLRARMGLHTGAAELRDGDYFGTTLNRTARLMAAGHGGQTLLSDVTQKLTGDTLPEEATLLPLGEYRLKDLARPETIYQLAHPTLVAAFPPLKTLDSIPNNLPQQVTSFVGREQPLKDVTALLGKTRLLTLTGSGGSGKTRLSLQVAAEVLEKYPDGAWLVELAPLSDAALVPQIVASVLGVREQAGQSITQTLTDALKPKRLLLVLDNCEHLLGACATLVAALIRACPNVTVLATSREPLGIGGETTYRVPALSLPDPKKSKSATAENLTAFESVRLFLDRALAVKPDFAITNANAPALAQVCWRLDGIPLAIELAASRIRSLTVEQINERLDSRFRLLTGGDRSALPRQQTLRALIDWSYDLLTDDEKALLGRLSVFSGGWTLDSAETVCSGGLVQDWETLDLLTGLADKSLVLAEEEDGASRYGMLETIRQYAQERLAASGEAGEIQTRHIKFFLALAEEAEPNLARPEQAIWLNRLEREHENLRTALDDCAARVASETASVAGSWGLRLSGALCGFWGTRGYLTEGREQIARALLGWSATSERQEAAKREAAKALRAAGGFARSQGDYTVARSRHEESLRLYRELGDKHGIALALGSLGAVAHSQADYIAARSFFEDSLHLHREIGNKDGIADTLNLLGLIAFSLADYPVAQSFFEQSLLLKRDIGDKQSIAFTLNHLGAVAHSLADYTVARSLYEESLCLHRENGNKHGIALVLGNLSDVALSLGDYAVARSLNEESLRLMREIGSKYGIAYGLEGRASLCHRTGEARQAVVLWAAADALRAQIGAPLPPGEQAQRDEQIEQVRSTLDAATFAVMWEEGLALLWNQAVRLALRE